MKKCCKCKKLLPETEFYKHNKNKDGLQNYCKKCCRKYQVIWKRKWREKYPEKDKIERDKYNHSEAKLLARRRYYNTEKGKQQLKIYRKEHPEIIKKSKKKYKKSGKKKRDDRNWRKNNKELIKEINREQKAKRKNFKYIELWKNPFPTEIIIQYHHINNFFVIPIPQKTHLSTNGKNHRENCNFLIEKLYCINLEEMLCQ